jgi:hypothetical protein
LAVAGQQPAGPGLAYLVGRSLQRRVAQLEVAEQAWICRGQLVQADAAPPDVQRVDENPAATGPGRDRRGVLQGGDAPVGHELDERTNTIGSRRLDQRRERVGQPGQVGVLAHRVDVPGAEFRRRLENRHVVSGSGGQPDRLHAEHPHPGVRAPAYGLGQHGGARPHGPWLLVVGHRTDPQPDVVEARVGGDRYQVRGRQPAHRQVLQPGLPRHRTSRILMYELVSS